MKHTKVFTFFVAVVATCYIAHQSVQRNTLAPKKDYSAITVALCQESNHKDFEKDLINELCKRMTQKVAFTIIPRKALLQNLNNHAIHIASLDQHQKTEPLLSTSAYFKSYRLVVPKNRINLYRRLQATLLEVQEDGTIADLKYRWNIA